MWLSGPITTVHYGHICQKLAAVARVGLGWQQGGGYRTKAGAPPWFSETIQSAFEGSRALSDRLLIGKRHVLEEESESVLELSSLGELSSQPRGWT